jgi:hypothetical protein
MALVSPGVEVQVIDESFYTPSAPGTVPMIFVATAENKTNSAGTGIATGTTKANAGVPFLLTSQKDLGDLFGDPNFYSDTNGNMIHGSELNEYGLQSAYSLLGVTNQVFVVRSDFDLAKLTPSANAPGGTPVDGSYWFDTQNTSFGILEWNAAAVNVTNGQSFTSVNPLVVSKASELDGDAPAASVGTIGSYAVVTANTMNRVFYKSVDNGWVEVGSREWKDSRPTVVSTASDVTVPATSPISINGVTIGLTTGETLTQVAAAINSGSPVTGVRAKFNTSTKVLELYATDEATNGQIVLADPNGDLFDDLGLTAATFNSPTLTIAPHTSVPAYKTGEANDAPTGSIWVKTTVPNGGADFNLKTYSASTQLWTTVSAPVYTSNAAAFAALDSVGGGANLAIDATYVRANVDAASLPLANFKLFSRSSIGATTITSAKILAATPAATNTITMAETIKGSATLTSPVTLTFTTTGAATDAQVLAEAINNSGLVNVSATVTDQNRVEITHALGGDFTIVDDGSLNAMGFAPYDATNSATTVNLYDSSPSGTWTASLWKPLTYTPSANVPNTLTADGEIWYNSVIDEVDIMYHNGITWQGYKNAYSDTMGPIVAAAKPTTQLDGTPLVDNDLWIDTADLENFPTVYRYSSVLGWKLIDKGDQTTENGMLFADARWATAGADSVAADIEDLLESDYLDADAPDPALYPKGMLLWNLRRSGFNVKRFVRNYVNVGQNNIRNSDESMANYYPHRWVTESTNNVDGSGSFGRHAQRKSVVQSLQAMVNGNQEIRDDERRFFNLMATPGYPELIGEMISLNYDRKLTAFIVGDTPLRLGPDATGLNNWATNANIAVEDNDNGLVSRDEYLGVYYPAGFTSDNAGNNVVVPASHMALRTIILSDQVAYPWLAPAGTRRGGVSNASAVGYISSEGEFVSIALNSGQRDVLYSNSINPITPISGSGLVVFGQKTRARNASALDRINVARLTVYLRRQLEILARPYLFEPNDAGTRDQVKAAADALLLELVGLRGIYDFVTVCDTTNNTPARVDKNELYLDVAIEPVKAIEFIYIPLRIKNTGEIASLG